MTLLFAEGSKITELPDARLREIVRETQRGATFERAGIEPPNSTRFHSSGVLPQHAYEYVKDKGDGCAAGSGYSRAIFDGEISKVRLI